MPIKADGYYGDLESLSPFSMPMTELADLNGSSGKPIVAGWSSLIGIITAIIGNILISFALNTQRYAHVRLEHEQNEREEQQRQQTTASQYGTIQGHIADDRAAKNAAAPSPSRDYDAGHLEESHDETDALIPSIQRTSIARSSETSQSSTPRASSPSGIPHDDLKRKNYLSSPWWWLGITLMVIGEAGNFLAYGFAPASIVSPLGVVALISNCLIAPFMLKERFRLRDLLGVVIAVGGAVTVVLSAKGSNPKLGPGEIWEMIKRWEFLTYLGVTVGCIVVLMIASNRLGEKTITIDIGLVGLFGGYTALSTKGVASMLSYDFLGAFTFPITYLLIAVLVMTAVMQIKYVNRALQRFDSTQVIPTQFVTFTIFVIVGSAVLYRDFKSTTATKVAQFVGGCALTFLGVWFITSGRPSSGDDDEEEGKRQIDVEEGIDLVDDTADTTPPSSSPPITPKARASASYSLANDSTVPDSPASFATASSSLTPTPTPQKRPAKPPLPRITATASSPLLPSDGHYPPTPSTPQTTYQHNSDSRLTPFTSASASASSSRHRPSGPTHTQSQSQTQSLSTSTPAASPSMRQNYTLMPSFSPGMLTSPLSSGLSVVVADQRDRLRRGSSVRGAPGGGNGVAGNGNGGAGAAAS